MAGPTASEAPESERMMAKPTHSLPSLRQPLSTWAGFVTKPNADAAAATNLTMSAPALQEMTSSGKLCPPPPEPIGECPLWACRE